MERRSVVKAGKLHEIYAADGNTQNGSMLRYL